MHNEPVADLGLELATERLERVVVRGLLGDRFLGNGLLGNRLLGNRLLGNRLLGNGLLATGSSATGSSTGTSVAGSAGASSTVGSGLASAPASTSWPGSAPASVLVWGVSSDSTGSYCSDTSCSVISMLLSAADPEVAAVVTGCPDR